MADNTKKRKRLGVKGAERLRCGNDAVKGVLRHQPPPILKRPELQYAGDHVFLVAVNVQRDRINIPEQAQGKVLNPAA